MSYFYISDDVTTGRAEDGDVVVLVASGELDYDATPRFKAHVLRYIAEGHRRVVLDLSTVTFIDSTAIGALVGAVVRFQRDGETPLAVVCAEENRRLLRIFAVAGVAGVVTLHRSREEAVRELVATG
jgi:anti-sigma B factor antagonist